MTVRCLPRRGVTLAELMIYAVLLLLLLAAIYASFMLSRRYYATVQAETEAQQEAVKAMLTVSEELSWAAADTLGDGISTANPQGIRFLSARTDERPFAHDPVTGDLLWQRWVCIYVDPAGKDLTVKERALTAPTAEVPEAAARPTVSSLVGDATLDERVAARGIVELTFPGASVGNFGVQVRSSVSPPWLPSGLTSDGDISTQLVLWSEVPLRQ